MLRFRFPLIFTLPYIAVGLLVVPPHAPAEDIVIREATTRSKPSNVGSLGRRVGPRSQGVAVSQSVDQILSGPVDEERSPRMNQFMGFPDIRSLVKKVNRSVVSIRMLEAGSSWSLNNLRLNNGKSGYKALGYGSGFIISKQGHILTNEHVLRSGNRIEVELLGGRKEIAKVLYKDSKNDLALLKIDTNIPLHAVEMGNSDSVELGEWVVGIGNPYGIGQSLMIGIVSAKKRTIPGSGYPPLIQIDAAMNLGNSGGPLFNLEGQVVGVNTILLWKSQGIGFATPVNVVKTFLARSKFPRSRSVAARAEAPLGPVQHRFRQASEPFNPLAPPWKFQQ